MNFATSSIVYIMGVYSAVQTPGSLPISDQHRLFLMVGAVDAKNAIMTLLTIQSVTDQCVKTVTVGMMDSRGLI